nr:HAMP domain-containing sensor histidine kinase [uncultured Agathobaculum sp.]
MIGKLRIKLIIASMVSLLTVLLVIMTAINLLNYFKIVSDADSTLTLLAENDGAFPGGGRIQPPPDEDFAPHAPHLSPEFPYETRYFFAVLDADGTVASVNTGKIAAVDTSEAIEYAQCVWQQGKTQGFLGSYRFLRSETTAGQTLILFLDCRRSLDTARTLLLSCLGVSTVGSLLVLLLLIFLSSRIVRPFRISYEKQKQFITDAGHELKTPLTIINADAELLAMDIGENEWLTDIQHQTSRLANLTGDLILLSRMEEAQPQLQLLELPLSDLVEETALPFQAVARTQGKTLDCHIEPLVSLCGEEKSLRKLVSILLDNAVKYAAPHSTITCTLDRYKGAPRLTVLNPVEGSVTREQTTRLFDRFYRTDQSRNSQTGGYGLGLSIAAAIVSAHKGRIIASAANDGAALVITVTFPA